MTVFLQHLVLMTYLYSTGFDVKKTSWILLKSSARLLPGKDQPTRLILS